MLTRGTGQTKNRPHKEQAKQIKNKNKSSIYKNKRCSNWLKKKTQNDMYQQSTLIMGWWRPTEAERWFLTRELYDSLFLTCPVREPVGFFLKAQLRGFENIVMTRAISSSASILDLVLTQ
eukprot:scpid96749/ scgid12356/ 